jgi:hypothetical protein
VGKASSNQDTAGIRTRRGAVSRKLIGRWLHLSSSAIARNPRPCYDYFGVGKRHCRVRLCLRIKHQRNRVFSLFYGCKASSQQKPGFWPPAHHLMAIAKFSLLIQPHPFNHRFDGKQSGDRFLRGGDRNNAKHSLFSKSGTRSTS